VPWAISSHNSLFGFCPSLQDVYPPLSLILGSDTN
jgi:hypothetical protein